MAHQQPSQSSAAVLPSGSANDMTPSLDSTNEEAALNQIQSVSTNQIEEGENQLFPPAAANAVQQAASGQHQLPSGKERH